MAELDVLRVFTDEEGAWGNPLGVFLEGRHFSRGERQRRDALKGAFCSMVPITLEHGWETLVRAGDYVYAPGAAASRAS